MKNLIDLCHLYQLRMKGHQVINVILLMLDQVIGIKISVMLFLRPSQHVDGDITYTNLLSLTSTMKYTGDAAMITYILQVYSTHGFFSNFGIPS